MLRRSPHCATQGFTIIEVMMASVILVVGFMGMIQAVTIGSEMMATARRQTLAAQILENEIGKLRLLPWDASKASPNEAYINTLATTSTPITIESYFNNAIAACGLTPGAITLSRTTTNIDPDGDGITDLKEVTFTLTWTKGGTSTAAPAATGSWLDRLSFYNPSSIARTYTRKSTALFGKYGLNLNIQRS
jgi:prepilin-type N-terminal cleavage/methylation domain-containing protein